MRRPFWGDNSLPGARFSFGLAARDPAGCFTTVGTGIETCGENARFAPCKRHDLQLICCSVSKDITVLLYYREERRPR
jgi:hypothetical protein